MEKQELQQQRRMLLNVVFVTVATDTNQNSRLAFIIS